MVLNAANISDESEKLARATVGELSYNSMKNKILQIFSGATSGAEATPDVKVEPTDTFYGTHNSKNNSLMNNKKDIVEVVIKVITEDTEEICRLEVIQMVTGCLEVATMRKDLSILLMNMGIISSVIFVNPFYTSRTCVHTKKII